MNDKKHLVSRLETILSYIANDTLKPEEKQIITRETIDNFNHFINPGIIKYRKSVSSDSAAVEWREQDNHIEDLDGNHYIDCLGGFGIYTCGHRNEAILNTVKAQLEHQCLHSQELLEPLRGYLAQTMAALTPGDLQYCFFTNGGAEAVEMALKLARLASKGQWYISTIGGFHGKSMGAVSMVGKDCYRAPYGPMIQQVQHVEFGNIDDLRHTIKKLITLGEKIAAVIMEPIQGEAGVIVPPKGYLKAVRALCDEYHILLIFDEIQTGLARTGTLWRCEAEEVVPDIMTYGKAFGGGILPITGLICRPHVWTEQLIDNPWLLGSPTFGGNPLCCSAALATLHYLVKHDIATVCRTKGIYLKHRLDKLAQDFPDIINDVRGVGLMLAIEFHSTEIGYHISTGLFDNKILVGGTLSNSRCIRFEPPATITEKELDQVNQTLGQILLTTRSYLQNKQHEKAIRLH